MCKIIWHSVPILLLAVLNMMVCAAERYPPGVHPIVLASYGNTLEDNLLGGTVDGQWVQPDDLWQRVMGGERYRLYSPFARLGIAIGQRAVHTESDSLFSAAVALDVGKAVRQSTEAVIGVCGTWNALPRVPRVLSPMTPAYRQLVCRLLDAHGMPPTVPVRITRLWRIDLEGDGQQEVLIEAATPGELPYEEVPRHYSLVVLRKIVGGAVRTTPLHAYYGVKTDLPMRTELKSVLDVNGDGVMEILTAWSWYEGSGMSIYTIKQHTATEALRSGQGL